MLGAMACIATSILLPACDRAPAAGGRILNVVCTTTMLADAASSISGGDAQVIGLMGPGVDPHLYTMTRADQKALLDADLVIYHGLHLEGKMAAFLEEIREESSSSSRKRHVVAAAAEAVPVERLISNPLFGEYPDPHVWFDLELWRLVVARIAQALADADPAHASAYIERGKRYQGELESVHSWALERTKELPETRRRIVTSHDAFNYFGRAYGYDVHGLQGISTETQAGLKDLEEAIRYIRENGVPAVFAETSVRRTEIELVAEKAGCRLSSDRLYSDALGAPGTPQGTLPGMFRHNLETILKEMSSQ